MTPAETLMHTTVRLECELNDGRTFQGTGFFFSFKIDDNKAVPLIVTNKHVISDSKIGTFVLTKCDDQGHPILGSTHRVCLDNFHNRWVKHPEDNVDLAAFAIGPLIHQAKTNGIKLYTPSIGEDLLPTAEKFADLSGLENITMIGYPNGIWDEKNNMPIVRRGITATNPKYDYNGLPIFVMDCACFPGSSGSPVLIFEQG